MTRRGRSVAAYGSLFLHGYMVPHTARLEGLEPPTVCLEGRCPIQLGDRRVLLVD